MSLSEVFTTSVVPRDAALVVTRRPAQLVAELHLCESACRVWVDAALDDVELGRRRSSVALAASCAEICAMAAGLLTRSEHGVQRLSRTALDLCVQAASSCADECDRQAGVAALDCSDACRSVLRAVSDVSQAGAGPPTVRGPRWSLDPVARRRGRAA